MIDRAYTGAQTEYAIESGGMVLRIWEARSATMRQVGENVILHCTPESILILEEK